MCTVANADGSDGDLLVLEEPTYLIARWFFGGGRTEAGANAEIEGLTGSTSFDPFYGQALASCGC